MNKLTKYILPTIIIGLISLFVLTNVSLAIDVPTAPTVPDKPHPTSPPTAPDKPHPTSPPSVPTVPPITTSPDGKASSTPTTKPGDGEMGGGNGGGGIGGPSGDGGAGGVSGNGGAGVQALPAASGENTDEIILMTIGLLIVAYDFKKVISKKLKI
ncbi:hypothetical protein HYT02_04785 [Candidatus Gottesmanbacteria bacterium]|nr:hypothetical protein [Candidatus Gottesmanbacteria bacterium]